MTSILVRETGEYAGFVLGYAEVEFAGNAYIEGAGVAAEDSDVAGIHGAMVAGGLGQGKAKLWLRGSRDLGGARSFGVLRLRALRFAQDDR